MASFKPRSRRLAGWSAAFAAAGAALLITAAAGGGTAAAAGAGAASATGEGVPWTQSLEPWGIFNLAKYIQDDVKSGKQLKYVVISAEQEGTWWTSFGNGIELAGKALGVKTQFVATQQWDVRQEVSNIKTVLQGKPDGVAIFVADANSMGPIIDQAIANGIPVITFNVDAPASKRLAYIGVDNFAYGRAVGVEMFKRYKHGQVILTSAVADSDYTRQRVAGLKSVAPKGVTFSSSTITITNNLSKAVGLVDAAVKKYPKANAIYGADDSVAAVGLWVGKNNKKGKYFVAGHNILPNDLSQAAAGTIQVLVGQFPHRQGFAAVGWLNNFVLSGEKDCFICDAGFYPVTTPAQAKSLLQSQCGGGGCG